MNKVLYNITFNLEDTRDYLAPSIPESACDDEDKTITRVCLSDSVIGCMQAIAVANRNVAKGQRFILRAVEVDVDLLCVVTPERVKSFVPDSLENQEYWSLVPVKFETVALCEIVSFDYDYELAWTCIEVEDAKRVVDQILPGLNLENCEDARSVYSKFLDYANREQLWDAMDEVWDALAELPHAQCVKIRNLVYDVVDSNVGITAE